MSNSNSPTEHRSLVSDGLSRRSFLNLMGVAGGATAFTGLLTACGSAEGSGSSAGGSASGGGQFLLGEAHATTGPAASTYRNYFIPANIAVQELNASGGIGGSTIKELLKDDQADPSKEPGVFRQFAQEKVNFVIGPNTSTTCLAAVPLATASKIVNLNVSTSDKLNDVKSYPYTFLIGPTNTPAMNAIVDFAVKQGWKKIALLHSSDAFGQQSVAPIKARAAKAGAELVIEVEHPVDATEMTPYVSKVQAAKPDVVICIQAIVATSTSMFNAFKNLNFDVPKIGTTSISSEVLRKAVPASVYANTYSVYLKSFSYTASEPVSQKNLDYVTKLTAQVGNFGGLTTAGLVYGPYDFIHMLKLAVDKAGGKDPVKVVQALEQLDPYDGVAGTIKFTPDSHNGLADDALVICKAASGGDATKSLSGFLLERA
ncbi:MAG: branched-chain amino acid transport system substrate-binding protein [Pseudonocardiales bacterium]|jgi:ABC-type branched-subunit amino acid transport system substrate-binding protein|nr:branched-chain amino acid transport system substrate-binding protein [Pseudonocardiales bacterium]